MREIFENEMRRFRAPPYSKKKFRVATLTSPALGEKAAKQTPGTTILDSRMRPGPPPSPYVTPPPSNP